MARVWIHDRTKDKGYKERAAEAKKGKRKPPRRWQLRWYDPEGRLKSELHEKLPEAENRQEEVAQQLKTHTYRDPKGAKDKVRKVGEAWFEARKSGWKPKTRNRYREILDGYIYPKWGATAVGAVTYEGVATWLSGLHKKPGLSGSAKRTVGAGRIQGIYQVMLGVMTWAVKSQRIPVNPISALDTLPSKPPPRRLYLDYAQIEALATAVAGLKDGRGKRQGKTRYGVEMYRVMVLAMAYCGLRIGEAMALRCSSIDLETMQLHVVEAVNEDDDGNPVIGLPKGDRIRVVGIPPFMAAEFKRVMAGRGDEDLVFTSPKGDLINQSNWRQRIWRPAVKEAKLPKTVTPHTLRHSFASLSVAEGCDVKTLQAAMGHSSPSITLEVYTDLFPARVWEVANALGAAREVALAA